MSAETAVIYPILEALDVAMFKTTPDGKEVLGFVGLNSALQPTIVVSANPPVNNDGRPDGTIYVQVT